MNTTSWLQTRYLPIPLIALMVLTRFHHFGDALHLPDASLAVFFFAGFYRKMVFFVFLLVLAGLIDYVAIAGGTSAYCISPAYVFLIPTYGVMWLAGRYCSNFRLSNASGLLLSLGLLALVTTVAFVISNGSFYLFSGRFDQLDWGHYFERTSGYYVFYVGSAIGYCAVLYTVVKLIKFLPGVQTKLKEF